MMGPFVYIASLRRTGSTVLAEALTSLPHSFIFVEPEFGENRWSLKEGDADQFRPHGVDLEAIRAAWVGARRTPAALDVLKSDVLPRLEGRVGQIGVKEIRHEGWRMYRDAFPEMRVVLTGRDPRDIFVSLFHRHRQGLGTWKGRFNPERVAEDLNGQFARQMQMKTEMNSIAIRYEDLVTDPGALKEVRAFVESEVSNLGAVGSFLSRAPGRGGEHAIHGHSITARQVERWRLESGEPAAEAARMVALMPEYCAFWDYR